VTILTGYFADPESGRWTKVHIVKDEVPVCGSLVSKGKEFLFCANGIYMPFVECDHCKRIGKRMLENELAERLKGRA
jgi:hypothetical protein